MAPEIIKNTFNWMKQDPKRPVAAVAVSVMLAVAGWGAWNAYTGKSNTSNPDNPNPLPTQPISPDISTQTAIPTQVNSQLPSPTQAGNNLNSEDLVINGRVIYPVTCYTTRGAPINYKVLTPLWEAQCLGQDEKGNSYWSYQGRIVVTTVDP